jgi:glutamate racemase
VLQEVSGEKKLKSVLIMATQATCRTGFYQQEFEESGLFDYSCLGCPWLAEAIENLDEKRVELLVQRYLTTEKKYLEKADSVVLACTHYPIYINLIESQLQKLKGRKDFKIYSQSKLVCSKLEHYLKSHKEYTLDEGEVVFYASSEARDFKRKLNLVFGLDYSVKPA